jgi:outer membrane lipoprotein-sorting protein
VCGCAFSQTAPSADDTETRGRKMLKEAIAALGGDAYLSAKDFTLSGRFYQIYHSVTSGAAVFVDYIKYPDKERQEIGKKKESIIIYNGDQGWDIDYRAVRAMTFEQMESYHRDQRYSLDRILRFDLKANKYRIYYDGSDLIEATKYDMVTLEDANRERMSILLNSRTHLPEALRYRLVDPKTGGVDRMESWYGNFQLVEGIMTPFHRERIRNGERISETFVNSMKYNSGLSDSLFTPR